MLILPYISIAKKTLLWPQALALAQLTGPQLRLVECHGTGTALGDPIETGALKATLAQGHGKGRSRDVPSD